MSRPTLYEVLYRNMKAQAVSKNKVKKGVSSEQ